MPIVYYNFFNPEDPPIVIVPGPLQWPITKVLTKRDIENGEIILPKFQVEDNILPLFHRVEHNLVDHRLPIVVRDVDTLTVYQLSFWKNGFQSYVLTDGWKNSFVRRRGLEVGAKVGFSWDQELRELHFTVLSPPPVRRED